MFAVTDTMSTGDEVYDLLVDIACDILEDGRDLHRDIEATRRWMGEPDFTEEVQLAGLEADLDSINAAIALWMNVPGKPKKGAHI